MSMSPAFWMPKTQNEQAQEETMSVIHSASDNAPMDVLRLRLRILAEVVEQEEHGGAEDARRRRLGSVCRCSMKAQVPPAR
jgi:hypothetical protein